MNLLNDDIALYAESISGIEDDVLKELTRETYLSTVHPRMISGYAQGMLLQLLVRMIRPKTVLEIGTFTGYSAICMARALDEGAELHTIEVDDELETIIRKYFNKAGVANRIRIIFGDALVLLPTITENYDVIFLDAEKSFYPELLELLKPKLRVGGYLLVDNVLWDGKVLNDSKTSDKMTCGVIRFNQMLKEDADFEKVIIPIRDGLALARKIR